MTCVPDGIIRSLTQEDFKKINLEGKINACTFMTKLKEHNKVTKNVTIQGNNLTEQELNENIKRIEEIDTLKLNNGYLCSSFEPLLNLVSELFEVDIDMNFNGTKIEYRNIKNSTRKINYSCSKTHFRFVKTNNTIIQNHIYSYTFYSIIASILLLLFLIYFYKSIKSHYTA